MSLTNSDYDEYSSDSESSGEVIVADINFDPLSFFKTTKELCYYKLVTSFFKTCDQNEITRMIEIINGTSIISLRVLDWFITKYSKKHTDLVVHGKEISNINIQYRAQLKSFKKKNFDPFRRGEKRRFKYCFYINDEPLIIETTIGQLNFFRWVITNKIIDYVQENLTTITKSMNQTNKTRVKAIRTKKIIKTTQIDPVKIATSKITDGEDIKITLSFD